MIDQVVFLGVLYLTGLSFCLLLRAELNIHLINLLSLPAGIAIWVICSMFTVMFSLPFELITLAFLMLGAYGLLVWFAKRHLGHYWWDQITAGDVGATVIWLVLALVIFNYAALTYAGLTISTDSLFYESLGRILFQHGRIDVEHPTSFWTAMHARLALIPFLHAAARLFGIDYLVTVYPATAIWFPILFMLLCYEMMRTATKAGKVERVLVIVLAGLLLIGSRMYTYLAVTRLLSGEMAMVCYSIALIALFLWDGRRKAWPIVSAVALAAAVLTRKEMAAFALIPIVLLVADSRRDSAAPLKLYLGLFVPLAYSWFAYGLWLNGFALSGDRGGFGVYLAMLAATLACSVPFMTVRFFDRHRTTLPTAAICALVLALLVSAFAIPDPTSVTITNLLTLASHEYWDTTWYLVLLGLAALFPFAALEQKRGYTFVIMSFFLLRILLYVWTKGPEDESWMASGNRILLFILPFSVFALAMFLASSGRRSERRNGTPTT